AAAATPPTRPGKRRPARAPARPRRQARCASRLRVYRPLVRACRRPGDRTWRLDTGTRCRYRLPVVAVTAAPGGTMRFGFFDQLRCASGSTERQRYQDIMAQIELGDALGLDTAWLGELHFSRGFSVLADPLMVLAAAAQRTTRIRLGTAVTLLPLHKPREMADVTALPAFLSERRLPFGVA